MISWFCQIASWVNVTKNVITIRNTDTKLRYEILIRNYDMKYGMLRDQDPTGTAVAAQW